MSRLEESKFLYLASPSLCVYSNKLSTRIISQHPSSTPLTSDCQPKDYTWKTLVGDAGKSLIVVATFPTTKTFPTMMQMTLAAVHT